MYRSWNGQCAPFKNRLSGNFTAPQELSKKEGWGASLLPSVKKFELGLKTVLV